MIHKYPRTYKVVDITMELEDDTRFLAHKKSHSKEELKKNQSNETKRHEPIVEKVSICINIQLLSKKRKNRQLWK